MQMSSLNGHKGKDTQFFSNTEEASQWILAHCQDEIHLATPLGLGKPNLLLNSIYLHCKAQPKRRLNIYTALSLALPTGKQFLEKRFLSPFVKRHYGEDYPSLSYIKDLKTNRLPSHISINEFYMVAGAHLHDPHMQSHYTSLNYTHAARALAQKGITLIVQMVAKRSVVDTEELQLKMQQDLPGSSTQYSLSCNPDITLDLMDKLKANKQHYLLVGVVHPDLPFMEGDAVIAEDHFDVILEDPKAHHTLFSLPRLPLQIQDHWIGFWGSQLIQDNGTLQIGIGSLSDALVSSTIFRQEHNAQYQKICQMLWAERDNEFYRYLDLNTFQRGLYGTSEMIMDGFMHLRRAKILIREVLDQHKDRPHFLHGAFFLGSKEFYQYLRELPDTERAKIGMTRVSKVNDLYDENEMALRRQRQNARFFNTCMQATVLGAAASETLTNGEVVSGVGGQYNFVAMAHELDDAKSILMLRSQRYAHGRITNNIVTGHTQSTIPRHLRDHYITEYGVASTRNASDQETVLAMIQIADVSAQDELLKWARDHKKISAHARLATWSKDNDLYSLAKKTLSLGLEKQFSPYPFGSDFTSEEQRLTSALHYLKLKTDRWSGRLAAIASALLPFSPVGTAPAEKFESEIQRMNLDSSGGLRQWFYRRLLLKALVEQAP